MDENTIKDVRNNFQLKKERIIRENRENNKRYKKTFLNQQKEKRFANRLGSLIFIETITLNTKVWLIEIKHYLLENILMKSGHY